MYTLQPTQSAPREVPLGTCCSSGDHLPHGRSATREAVHQTLNLLVKKRTALLTELQPCFCSTAEAVGERPHWLDIFEILLIYVDAFSHPFFISSERVYHGGLRFNQ